MDWICRDDLLNQAPDQAYLYRVRDTDRTIIYVGKTLSEPGGRFSSHHNALWWDQAAGVEVAAVPRETAASAESSEIHRWHPAYNKQCVLCTSDNKTAPLYPVWRRLSSRHHDKLHPPWRDLAIFIRDIRQLLGPRPPEHELRRIDPHGKFEPGNVQWHHKILVGVHIRSQILDLITERGSARMHEIRDALLLTDISASTHLARLVQDGDLIRPERGVYTRTCQEDPVGIR